MKVTFFHRRPQPGHFSIERLFGDVRAAMPADVEGSVKVARFFSLGWWRRLLNLLEAPFFQGAINHVTGDIHYVDLLLAKRKTILTIHDCASLERLRGWRRELLRLFWYTLPVRRAGLITTNSETTKTELLRHVRCDPQKVRVVHCCVSPDFQPDPRPFHDARPRVLQVGTAKNKNLPRVAEALAGIACHLHVIGRLDAEQRAALERHGVEHSVSADLDDAGIVAAYRECDLVVFASTIEGFGMPIVEANAVGRPVVTSNAYSMPEAAGAAACLVNPLDAASIRNGVLRLMHDAAYRRQLIDEGYANARRFSPPKPSPPGTRKILPRNSSPAIEKSCTSSRRSPPSQGGTSFALKAMVRALALRRRGGRRGDDQHDDGGTRHPGTCRSAGPSMRTVSGTGIFPRQNPFSTRCRGRWARWLGRKRGSV